MFTYTDSPKQQDEWKFSVSQMVFWESNRAMYLKPITWWSWQNADSDSVGLGQGLRSAFLTNFHWLWYMDHTFNNKDKVCSAKYKWSSGPSGRSYNDCNMQPWHRILNWKMTAQIIREEWPLIHNEVKGELPKALRPVWFCFQWASALGFLILSLLFFPQIVECNLVWKKKKV